VIRAGKIAVVVPAMIVICSLLGAMNPPVDPAATSSYQAYVTSAEGQVSIERDQQPWAVSSGEHVPIQQLITTGNDGLARFEVNGGSNFEVFANSKVAFRRNPSSAGDLLDVMAGRVRIHLNPGPGQPEQRVFCPIAIITAVNPATIALAIDEDDNVRIDVLEGEVTVQHKLLPRSYPTVVRAVDAILVDKHEQISRQLDRGTLYRYTIKPFHDLFAAMTPGHKGSQFQCLGENKLFAWARPRESRR
jgi:hypothetical protein